MGAKTKAEVTKEKGATFRIDLPESGFYIVERPEVG